MASSSEICTSFSSVLPPNQISRCYDANNQSNINIFPPLQPDGGGDNQCYVCIDSYSFTLKIFPPWDDLLALKIANAKSGVVCVTIIRKTEDDHEQDLLSKFECIYPENVINGKANGRIRDVILAHDGYNILNDAKFLDGPGTLNLRNSNIRHPIYYPLPKDMHNDAECQRVTFNAYIRDNTFPPHSAYNALFDTTTGRPSRILIDSFIKIQVCNLAYIQAHTTSRATNSDPPMYLLGSCDTREHVANTEYPFKLKFLYVGADSSDSSVLTRTDLQLDPAKVWEVAVQSITYNTSDKVMIPSPSWAKQQGIYDLYAGEILVSGPEFYPIGHDENNREARHDIHDIINNIHKVPEKQKAEIRSFTDQFYGHFLKCRQELTDAYQLDYVEKHLLLARWYDNDLMERFDPKSVITRAPLFRWNYTNVMYANILIDIKVMTGNLHYLR